MGNELMLSPRDQSLLDGDCGPALQFAMKVVVRGAELLGAPRLIDAQFVHVDSCHYYGRAHLDFAKFFVQHAAQFDIPAWTNTIPISLRDTDVRDPETEFHREAKELAEQYVALGCQPVWTCAPYQLPAGPKFGDQIVGSESNAVTYFNSVVGARTNKYGDFLDVCCGLVARVPDAGFHTNEGRRGEILFDIGNLPMILRQHDAFYHVLGHLIGGRSQSMTPVIAGLPSTTNKDDLKAISAAVAASGGVALFHGIGVTPEADTIEQAFLGGEPTETVSVTSDQVVEARDSLSSAGPGKLNMVAVGTPHFSMSEFERLVRLLDGARIHCDLTFYVSTSRFVAENAAAMGWMETLNRAGVTVVVDTCTYFSPRVKACRGRVMTNSAKWAYYSPGMLDVEVVFGSLEDCVQSAIKGEVRRDCRVWGEPW
ncbi:MAG: aconitase X catalytic domain-containing protein [Pseudomonadota bacterium]